MRLREADRFSEVELRLAMVEVKRFWIAPMSAREEFTEVSALSMMLNAFCAPWKVEMSTSFRKLVVPAAAVAVAAMPLWSKVMPVAPVAEPAVNEKS
ncbi:hypothetical protein NB706_003699 [Xanthomonas sacchari]|nr:hypothetical protein [Xanthomonas sacchari]